MNKISLGIWLSFSCLLSQAQDLKIQKIEIAGSYRGIAVAPGLDVFCASGTRNTFLISTDGGLNWTASKVGRPEDSTDFRDLEILEDGSVLLMGITKPACVYRREGLQGEWKKVFSDSSLFLDAMAFNGAGFGRIIGDPIDGRWTILETRDAGKTWISLPENECPIAEVGEAAFAASGTACIYARNGDFLFVSGGLGGSRLYRQRKGEKSWLMEQMPFVAKEGSGAFSVLEMGHYLVVSGGDYTQAFSKDVSAVLIDQRNNTVVKQYALGYRCAAIPINKNKVLLIGDKGMNIYDVDRLVMGEAMEEGYFTGVCKDGSCILIGKNKGAILNIR